MSVGAVEVDLVNWLEATFHFCLNSREPQPSSAFGFTASNAVCDRLRSICIAIVHYCRPYEALQFATRRLEKTKRRTTARLRNFWFPTPF